MEPAAAPPSRISRLGRRYRSRPRHVRPDEDQKIEARGENPQDAVANEPGLQGERQPVAMRQRHHSHHRRAPQADTNAEPVTKIVTVDVEVIATVDSSGNVVGHETRTRDPTVPTPLVGQVSEVSAAPVPAAAAPVAAAPVAEAAAAVVSSALNAAGSIASPVAAVPVAILSSILPGVAAVPTPVPAPVSLPQVPAVPPFPTNALPTVPSVPAVPSFPSDLRVPSYPWPSGVSAAALAVSTASPALSSRSSSATPALSSATPTLASSLSSLTSSLSGSQIMSRSASGSLSSLDSISATLSSDSTASSIVASITGSSTAGATVVPGVGGRPNTGAPPAQGTAAPGTAPSGSSSPLPTPKVVGSVVGTLAGAALILAIILILLRRHKRKRQGALQLTGDDNDRVPAMSQPSPRSNRIPSGFLNRFSGMSRSTAETSTSGGERSFQRVSGRKLPSAFSEGMTSEQFSRGGTMSGSSFYQDDHGTYGGPGSALSKEFGKEIGGGAAGAGAMSFKPGPARTPIIKHPDDDINPFADPAPFPRAQSHLSPPGSPDQDPRRGTLGRSLHSHDGSRSSKFTENV